MEEKKEVLKTTEFTEAIDLVPNFEAVIKQHVKDENVVTLFTAILEKYVKVAKHVTDMFPSKDMAEVNGNFSARIAFDDVIDLAEYLESRNFVKLQDPIAKTNDKIYCKGGGKIIITL